MSVFKERRGKIHTVENIGEKMNVNIPLVDYYDILERTINERLMIQEGERIGFDNIPGYTILDKYRKFNIKLELLRKDEIINKDLITEEEIYEEYKYEMESINVWHLFTKDREKGKRLLKALKNGADFEELVEQESEDPPSLVKKKGNMGYLRRNQLRKELSLVVFALEDGEVSELINTNRGYHILKRGEKKEPPETVPRYDRSRIYNRLFSAKLETREREFIEQLKQKSLIVIDNSLLRSLNFDKPQNDIFLNRNTIIAVVNGVPIKEFEIKNKLKQMRQKFFGSISEKSKRNVLDSLIRNKLIDFEVGTKNYENDERFKEKIALILDSLYLDFFLNVLVLKSFTIVEPEIIQYYGDHLEDFKKSKRVRFSLIQVSSEEKAKEIVVELEKGADFGILASDISTHTSRKSKGNMGWMTGDQLANNIREMLENEEIGGIYGPFYSLYGYQIVKLDDRKEGEYNDFDSVKTKIRTDLTKTRYEEILKKYTDQLRKNSKIWINERLMSRYIKSKKQKEL